MLFVLYLAATFCLALYDGDVLDIGNYPEVCIITINTYSMLSAFPLSIIVSALWILVVSEVGETDGIRLPEDESEDEE